MVAKQNIQGLYAPDGATYVTITDGGGNLTGLGTAGLPSGATPLTGVFSGADTASAAATLTVTAGKTGYITGFSVSGLGATGATTVIVAITGPTNTLSYSYVFVAGATLPNTPILFNFNTPIPASAVSTNIVVTVPGSAGNTATQINVWGFQV